MTYSECNRFVEQVVFDSLDGWQPVSEVIVASEKLESEATQTNFYANLVQIYEDRSGRREAVAVTMLNHDDGAFASISTEIIKSCRRKVIGRLPDGVPAPVNSEEKLAVTYSGMNLYLSKFEEFGIKGVASISPSRDSYRMSPLSRYPTRVLDRCGAVNSSYLNFGGGIGSVREFRID